MCDLAEASHYTPILWLIIVGKKVPLKSKTVRLNFTYLHMSHKQGLHRLSVSISQCCGSWLPLALFIYTVFRRDWFLLFLSLTIFLIFWWPPLTCGFSLGSSSHHLMLLQLHKWNQPWWNWQQKLDQETEAMLSRVEIGLQNRQSATLCGAGNLVAKAGAPCTKSNCCSTRL